MSFNQMLQKDIDACSEPMIVISHEVEGQSKDIKVVFDNSSLQVLTKGENAGMEALVPSLTLGTHNANEISHKSFFVIENERYGVLEIQNKSDMTTTVLMERL